MRIVKYIFALLVLSVCSCIEPPHPVDVVCGGPPFSEKSMTETIPTAVAVFKIHGGFEVMYQKYGKNYTKKYPLSCRYYDR